MKLDKKGMILFLFTDLPSFQLLTKSKLHQVVFIPEKVRIIWEPFLFPSTYRKSIYKVLKTVSTRVDGIAAEI